MSSPAATADSDRPPSVAFVDLSLLSQSELYSLSLSSDLTRSDDVIIPKLNPNVFNESAGSRKQTYSRLRLHRRTPHLRASHSLASHNLTDPDLAENSHIIRMLKQLCKTNPNFNDIDDANNENYENHADVNFGFPLGTGTESMGSIVSMEGTETVGVKRKRGRPRKDENAVFIREKTDKRICSNVVKKEVVYDCEMDRGIVNERGVEVDVVGIGGMEDPYGAEIRRRTFGMWTEDELLGFMRGVEGQWGSQRRKRRVVEASEFGDVLPKGWKLSLCIKKKEGRAWVYVRRYLSPSGQQFETCKEISTYLTSLFGEENPDKQNLTNINSSDDFALKEASENAEACVLREDIKRDSPVDNPSSLSPSPTSTSSLSPLPPPAPPNLDAMEVQVKDDVENNNIGSHVKNDLEKTEPSVTPTSELDCPVLVGNGGNVIVETDAHSSGKLNLCKESDSGEPVHDLNTVSHDKQEENTNIHINDYIEESCDKSGTNAMMNGELSRTDQAPDAAVSESELVGDEVPLSISEQSSRRPETSSEQTGNASGVREDDIINVCATERVLDQDNISETGVSNVDPTLNKSECILNEKTSGDGGGAVSVGMQDLSVPETSLVKNASVCEEKGFDPTMDLDMDDDTSDQLISKKDKGVHFRLDKDGVVKGIDSVKAVETETLISSQKQESHGTYNNNNTDSNVNKLSSALTSSRLGLFNVGTDAFGGYGASSSMEGPSVFQEENELSKSEEVKLDDLNIFRNSETIGSESEDVLDFNTKGNLEFCSLIPSENEQAFGIQDCIYDDTMDECKEESSERGLLNHFSDDIFDNKMYSTSLDGLKFGEDRDLSSNELSLAFGNPNVPSKIEEAFDVHTNLSMVNSSMVEDQRGSVGGLFNLSGNVKTSNFQNAFKSSGNKFATGFGSNLGQAHEEAVPSGMWRTGDGNQVQSGLSIPSHAHTSSPSSFHSFNIMSEKAGDGQFRLDDRYNSGYGVNGLRSGRPEPVEFSFLTARSQHPLQGDSRVYSYNTEMDQQFDSSFWLGKNTMMPNPAGRNQMTGVCAMCREEFHLQPVHFGTQDGMASLCPSCSAGMSGHVNML